MDLLCIWHSFREEIKLGPLTVCSERICALACTLSSRLRFLLSLEKRFIGFISAGDGHWAKLFGISLYGHSSVNLIFIAGYYVVSFEYYPAYT